MRRKIEKKKKEEKEISIPPSPDITQTTIILVHFTLSSITSLIIYIYRPPNPTSTPSRVHHKRSTLDRDRAISHKCTARVSHVICVCIYTCIFLCVYYILYVCVHTCVNTRSMCNQRAFATRRCMRTSVNDPGDS